jgi:hypothetical protein
MTYIKEREALLICGGICSWDPYTFSRTFTHAHISEVIK